ncbi:MAG: 50S ribosomal protein L27 [uncultured bacterium]|nr:MAG: 50S ribosomal protein L27 [uncultured bacterium]
MGLKVSSGEFVKTGEIIVRQRGRTFIPGQNVGIGRDFTLFSKVNGVVQFINDTRKKKKIKVNPKE